MDKNLMIIIGIALLIIIGMVAAVYFIKRKNITKFFEQISIHTKQVPKSKKASFILLMITQTLAGSNKKTRASLSANMNNQKFVEVQLLKMTKILKDPTGDHDKRTMQALDLFKKYQAWEELMKANNKAV